MAEKVFEARRDALDEVNDYLEGLFDEADVPFKVRIQVLTAVEEIFINIASYAYEGGEGTAVLETEINGDAIKLVFKDQGIPFDPLAKPDPDITLSAEERGLGGLGIYMVKKMMDQVSYVRSNGWNILTLEKKF